MPSSMCKVYSRAVDPDRDRDTNRQTATRYQNELLAYVRVTFFFTGTNTQHQQITAGEVYLAHSLQRVQSMVSSSEAKISLLKDGEEEICSPHGNQEAGRGERSQGHPSDLQPDTSGTFSLELTHGSLWSTAPPGPVTWGRPAGDFLDLNHNRV